MRSIVPTFIATLRRFAKASVNTGPYDFRAPGRRDKAERYAQNHFGDNWMEALSAAEYGERIPVDWCRHHAAA